MAYSKSIYDLTEEQAHHVASIALNDGTPEFNAEEINIETPTPLQRGLMFEVSFRCWDGNIWLSIDRRGIAMRSDDIRDDILTLGQKTEIENYLVAEGLWK